MNKQELLNMSEKANNNIEKIIDIAESISDCKSFAAIIYALECINDTSYETVSIFEAINEKFVSLSKAREFLSS